MGKSIQGRFDIARLRTGKLAVLKLDFAFENGAVLGNFSSMIAQKPVPQINADIIQF